MSAPRAPSPPADCRFPKRRRIPSSSDFSEIIGRGSFATDETLIVNALPTKIDHQRGGPQQGSSQSSGPHDAADRPPGRLGVTVPRKAGKAVVRNRWKRLIREAYRLQQHELPPGFDFVVRPRRGAVADFDRVRRSLRRLTARAAAVPPKLRQSKPPRPAKNG